MNQGVKIKQARNPTGGFKYYNTNINGSRYIVGGGKWGEMDKILGIRGRMNFEAGENPIASLIVCDANTRGNKNWGELST